MSCRRCPLLLSDIAPCPPRPASDTSAFLLHLSPGGSKVGRQGGREGGREKERGREGGGERGGREGGKERGK